MGRIIMVTRGTGGDLFPFLRLGRLLHTLGNEVLLISHAPYEQRVREYGLEFAPLDTVEEFELIIDANLVLRDPKAIGRLLQEQTQPILRSEYELIRHYHSPANTVLVGHHNSQFMLQIAAERLKIPFVTIFMAPTFLLSTPLLADIYASSAAEINTLRSAYGLPAVFDWKAWTEGWAGSIAFWPEWFASPNSQWPQRVTQAGFLLNEGVENGEVPASIQAILEEPQPPILITHATSKSVGSRFFASAAEACALLNRRGVLVTPHAELVPDPLPDCVTWVKYLPFSRVMPSMGAVIHHGGIGTLAQTLAAGVPQLVLGLGFDRPDNGARLQRLGIGEYLPPPQWQPDLIAAALQRLLGSDAVHKRCKGFVGWSGQEDPVRLACQVIEKVATVQAGNHLTDWQERSAEEATVLAISSPAHPGEISRLLMRLSPERRALLAQQLARRERVRQKE